jgi:ribonuclease P protein component
VVQNLFFMMTLEKRRYTLNKSERLCSKKLIERLFAGGNKSFPSFPLRVVYMTLDTEETTADASILISVPKKRFKHAVKRNLVKRQVREAYRHHKHILLDAIQVSEQPKKIILAFIWLDYRIHTTEEVDFRVKKLLQHVAEDKL